MNNKKSKRLCAGIVFSSIILLTTVASNAEQTMHINFLTWMYSGQFDGSNTFICQDGSDPFELVCDSWDGLGPVGDVTITFESGHTVECTYNENNIIEGTVKDISSDWSYKTYQVDENGFPYGKVLLYDENDTVIGYDWYFQTQLVSELKQESVEIDYRDMLQMSPDMTRTPVRIQGNVCGIYDDQAVQYVLIQDADSHIYAALYNNSEMGQDPLNQALTSNLQVGDEVTAYGYLWAASADIKFNEDETSQLFSEWIVLNKDKLENSSPSEDVELYDLQEEMTEGSQEQASNDLGKSHQLTSTIPYFVLISADTGAESAINLQDIDSISYEEIIKNPYLISGETIELSGEIISASIDTSDSKEEMYLKVTADEVYYIEYSFDEEKMVPVVGEKVVISGVFDGNHKQKLVSDGNADELTEYIIYPRLLAEKVDLTE